MIFKGEKIKLRVDCIVERVGMPFNNEPPLSLAGSEYLESNDYVEFQA